MSAAFEHSCVAGKYDLMRHGCGMIAIKRLLRGKNEEVFMFMVLAAIHFLS